MPNALAMAGLSMHEELVYTTVLALGTCTVSTISRRVNMPRATVYLSLDTLAKKHLVSEVAEGTIKQFCANSPEILSSIVARRNQKFESVLSRLFLLWARHTNEPKVIIGRDAIKKFLDETLVDGIRSCLVVENVSHETVVPALTEFFERCTLRGIHVSTHTTQELKEKNMFNADESLNAQFVRILIGSYDISIELSDLSIAYIRKKDLLLNLLNG